MVSTQSTSDDQQTKEAIDASTQALEFLQKEIFNLKELFEALITYKMPSFDGGSKDAS